MLLLTPLFYLMGYRLHWGVLSISEAARGFCLAMATWLFFLALKSLPMAEAISIFFIEPMILTILAALILKERILQSTYYCDHHWLYRCYHCDTA